MYIFHMNNENCMELLELHPSDIVEMPAMFVILSYVPYLKKLL